MVGMAAVVSERHADKRRELEKLGSVRASKKVNPSRNSSINLLNPSQSNPTYSQTVEQYQKRSFFNKSHTAATTERS